jgi:hypothetical protein
LNAYITCAAQCEVYTVTAAAALLVRHLEGALQLVASLLASLALAIGISLIILRMMAIPPVTAALLCHLLLATSA